MARPKKINPAVQNAVTAEDLIAKFADFPAIDVLSRRFNDPNDPGSLPILLRDEDPACCVNSDHQNRMKQDVTICHLCKRPNRIWYVRFTNTSQEGRWAQIRSKGYVPVNITELRDEQDVADLVKGTGDQYVRRGDRGQEILVKMPMLIYNHIKSLQRAERKTRSLSVKQLKADLAEAAGTELGDEAGSMIHNGGIMVESFKRTKTTLQEEAGGE